MLYNNFFWFYNFYQFMPDWVSSIGWYLLIYCLILHKIYNSFLPMWQISFGSCIGVIFFFFSFFQFSFTRSVCSSSGQSLTSKLIVRPHLQRFFFVILFCTWNCKFYWFAECLVVVSMERFRCQCFHVLCWFIFSK